MSEPDSHAYHWHNRVYTRAELLSDAIVHWAALTVALAAVPVLITLTAVWHGNTVGVVGVSLYGVTLIAMLGASLAYNHIARPTWRDLLARLDHSAIYLKIAGTYTPISLLSGAGGGLLAGIWSVALAGTVGTFVIARQSLAVAVALCLAMGWAMVFGGQDVLARLSAPVVAMMIGGGVLYTLGVAFLMWDRLRFHNTIWHVFVVAASTIFFVAIFVTVAQTAPRPQ
ncbi:MAG: hemolysin III family protein [Pseudomonadota bacterium]